jgi:hypothetical protein
VARKVVVALLSCFLVMPTTARAEPSIAKIVGLGGTPCTQFEREANDNPAVQREYLARAQGFMSGILIGRPPVVDEGLDLNPATFGLRSQLEFLRDHCHQHPAEGVSDAAIALYKRLRAQART